MLATIQIVLLIGIGSFLFYLAFLSLMACWKRKTEIQDDGHKHKFAVVVPAHNEETEISHTLQSIFKVDYDSSKYEVIVIADNCTDRTAEVAREAGASVLVRNDPRKKGKGYALRWCFDRLIKQNNKNEFDAAIVVDADTHVAENMLDVMNKHRSGGAQVIQGYLGVGSKSEAWTGQVINIGYTLYNWVRPAARKTIGFPTGLKGNGMCFSIDVLEKVPWDAFSLTEDLEYGLKLMLNNVDVVFAPEHIGYSVIPDDPKQAESQRERWEMGRFPILKKFAGPLLKKALKKRSLKIFDAFIDLITPPLVNMVLFSMIMTGLSILLWITGIQQTPLYILLWILTTTAGVFHALVGLYAAGAGSSVYLALAYVPRYALWKVYVYLKVLLINGKTTEWVRTSRDSGSNM